MERKFYIPEIGDAIKLTQDWTFSLRSERRNNSLWEALSLPALTMRESWGYDELTDARKQELIKAGMKIEKSQGYYTHHVIVATVTLPKDTILTVDRIYIRKGNKEFSSITFFVNQTTIPHKKALRFWVKLPDANTMMVDDTVVPSKPKPKKPKVGYMVWAEYEPSRIAADHYLAARIRDYDKTGHSGKMLIQLGQSSGVTWPPREWQSNPRYYHAYHQTQRTPDKFIEYMKQLYGHRLKAIGTNWESFIYEAP